MRIVYFGTPRFAVATLERLLASSHEVVAVVTQPDRRRGRGQKVSASAIKDAATTHGLTVLQPEQMKDPVFFDTMTALVPDLGVVAAYGKLLPDQLLALPRFGMINVHASLLPKYRGAAPIHRAIMNGETETGITIIQLVHEMDAGPMLRSASQSIGPDDTSETLDHSLATLGADLLVATVDDIEAGRAQAVPQDHDQATFAPRLSRDDGVIDWNRPATEIRNRVRGLLPWPHAFSFLDGRRIMFLQSTVVDWPETTGELETVRAGTILKAAKDRLVVSAGAHTALAIHELLPEGRRPLATRAFLSGRRLQPGDVFRSSAS